MSAEREAIATASDRHYDDDSILTRTANIIRSS